MSDEPRDLNLFPFGYPPVLIRASYLLERRTPRALMEVREIWNTLPPDEKMRIQSFLDVWENMPQSAKSSTTSMDMLSFLPSFCSVMRPERNLQELKDLRGSDDRWWDSKILTARTQPSYPPLPQVEFSYREEKIEKCGVVVGRVPQLRSCLRSHRQSYMYSRKKNVWFHIETLGFGVQAVVLTNNIWGPEVHGFVDPFSMTLDCREECTRIMTHLQRPYCHLELDMLPLFQMCGPAMTALKAGIMQYITTNCQIATFIMPDGRSVPISYEVLRHMVLHLACFDVEDYVGKILHDKQLVCDLVRSDSAMRAAFDISVSDSHTIVGVRLPGEKGFCYVQAEASLIRSIRNISRM